jgi:hypothetical protein
MHLLLFLKADFKPFSLNVVNNIITVQWPDPETQPCLFKAVKKVMVHSPYGLLNPHAPCMKDRKCIHSYSKLCQVYTMMDHNGYPHYAHPDNGCCMLWLQCHINIKCAICFGSMKYINKYIDKGGDCSTLSLHDQDDEIKQYING